MPRLRLVLGALTLALVSCGPTAEVPGDATAGSTTGPGASPSSSTSTTTGAPPSSTTSGTTGPQCAPLGSSCADGTPCCDGVCNGDSCEEDGFETCGFLCPPDIGCGAGLPDGTLAHCSPGSCDPFEQDCPDGEKCVAWANDGGNAWNATKCVPVDPNPGQPGDPCTVEGSGVSGIDDCDAGAMCWLVDIETNTGTCVALCQGNEARPACADPELTCMIANDGTLTLCVPSCNPLLQDCGTNQVCIGNRSGDGFVCVLDASGEEGVAGDPCEYLNVCDPGLFCANASAVEDCAGSSGCCAPFCDLNDADPSGSCPGATEECVPWYEMGMEVPGLENVGACVIPA